MQNKFGPELFLSNVANLRTDQVKAGQWVRDLNTGIRGQYLGKTTAGVIVIRWQADKFGKLADCKSNHHLRQFAIVNGAK